MRARRLIIARRISQLAFLVFFVYILWSAVYPLESKVPTWIFFRTDPNLTITTSLSERVFLPGILLSGGMLLIAAVFGRLFCGWVCPLGTIVDWAGSARMKTGVPSEDNVRVTRQLKSLILLFVLAGAVLGIQAAWILDPIVIVARFVSLNLIPAITIAFDKAFIFLVRDLGMTGAAMDLYRGIKASFPGINAYYFPNAWTVFALFLMICSSSLIVPRFWCRYLCPLGALYALFSRTAFLRRKVEKCGDCGICASRCRMSAIKSDQSYVKSECILCMDCLYDCPGRRVTFGFPVREKAVGTAGKAEQVGLSRKGFLFLFFSWAFLPAFRNKRRAGRGGGKASGVIRPPASLEEPAFLSRCVRCGNCMKVCPTNGLQPVMLESGLEGIWTPQLVPEIGYCEYNCTLCGEVCPTGAIPRLSPETKKQRKLGTASVDHKLCIAWAYGQKCLVCEEHCPVPGKAIRTLETMGEDGTVIKRPVVDPSLCVGCGICQTKCPVSPVRAIKVDPSGADRTKGTGIKL